MGQNLSYLVRMPKYGHILFCSQLSQFVSNFDEIYIQVFKRLVATSRAPQIMVLSMLRSFGKIGPQIDQIWAWLSRGHRWSAGVRNPLKSSVTGPSLLVNCYLEIKFHKIIRVNPPLKKDYVSSKRQLFNEKNMQSLESIVSGLN